MKNILIITIALLTICCTTSAQQVEHIMLNFNANDYSISDGKDYIIDKHYHATYLEDTQLPAIPFVPIQVKLPVGYDYADMSFTSIKQFFAENVLLENNPECVPTDSVYEKKIVAPHNYPVGIYPQNNVIYTGRCDYGNVIVATFLVSPWVYDSERGTLELMTTINLDIELKPRPKAEQSRRPSELSSLLDLLVVNPDKTSSTKRTEDMPRTASGYDYVIITSTALSSAFNPLKQWKTMKGVRTKIVTVPEIDQQYTDSTIQLKIKHYLYDCFQNEGLKYVLLGGDDTVVPVQRCYAIVNRLYPSSMREDNTIPSDLFYSCFSGSFNWNANNNDTIAEIADGVDFTQYLYVSRLPVRTSEHVNNITKKILDYEKNPDVNSWQNNILMCGNMLWDTCYVYPRMSDAQAKSENLYSQAIEPYWQGNRIRFYDTYTDYSGGASYQLNANNLQTELAKGFTFMEMATHGSQTTWKMESFPTYGSEYASSLANSAPTIITTMACLTNAFDNSDKGGYSDPCLSEAFIRNYNSGVVAYLGCSRQGWGYNSHDGRLGISFQYEKEFYSSLFSNIIKDKNWGKTVSIAKSNKISPSCYEGSSRWVQLGLNPIGDPEMPIFTTTPQVFSQCSIIQNNSGTQVIVNEDSCRICVMSLDDDGQSVYQVYKDTNSIIISPSSHTLQVCITKQNYIPKLFLFNSSDIFIQNEILSGNICYKGNRICVGTAVTNYKEYGDVTIVDGNITLNAEEITIDSQTTIEEGSSLNIINE